MLTYTSLGRVRVAFRGFKHAGHALAILIQNMVLFNTELKLTFKKERESYLNFN